jgi:HEAT repeat protein
MTNRQVRRLIEKVYQHGESHPDGRAAIKALAAAGEPALRAMLSSLANPPRSEQHPIDLWDSIQSSFNEFARTVPDSVIDSMEEGTLAPFVGHWALGAARGARSIDALIGGLKHKDAQVRWAATEALVARRVKRAIPALLEALKDRSTAVQATIVFAMQSHRMYRRPEAIAALERILANRRIRKSSPGLWRATAELIRQIKLKTSSGLARKQHRSH